MALAENDTGSIVFVNVCISKRFDSSGISTIALIIGTNKKITMGFWDNLFNRQTNKNPEDDFVVTITETFIRVEHPELKTDQIYWKNIEAIQLRNTDGGPWLPDVWLTLIGKDEICVIPQGAKGYDEVYEIVSKYEGFNFENVIKSMACTDNAEFDLWTKK